MAEQQSRNLTGDWLKRHQAALTHPRASERGIVGLIAGWTGYAQAHRETFEDVIGHDHFLGREWYDIGKAILQLLNGDLGRLDGGSLDAGVRAAMMSQGFTEKEIDEGL